MKTGSWLAVAPPELRHIKNRRHRWLAIAFLVAAVMGSVAFVVVVGATVFGCAAVGPACKVIDVAHDVCTVIAYTDERGVKHAVRVTPEELRSLGKAATAREAAAATTGSAAPAGSARP